MGLQRRAASGAGLICCAWQWGIVRASRARIEATWRMLGPHTAVLRNATQTAASTCDQWVVMKQPKLSPSGAGWKELSGEAVLKRSVHMHLLCWLMDGRQGCGAGKLEPVHERE